MPELTKVVIPVAGLGTRLLPASKVIPKEMLTVVDKPIIQHVVEEAIDAGFREIILVTRNPESVVKSHFETNLELETELINRGNSVLLDRVKNILPSNVCIESVQQSTPKGLGHAVLCASPLVGNDPFAVILPDVLINNRSNKISTDLSNMVLDFKISGAAQIMVEEVPPDDVEKYGIVDCAGMSIKPGDSQAIVDMVEKPKAHEAPSNLSIVGRYVLPARVLELLSYTKPGAGNEIQLTDALALLLREPTTVNAYHMLGESYDCGNKLGFIKANFVFGLTHPEVSKDFRDFVSQFPI